MLNEDAQTVLTSSLRYHYTDNRKSLGHHSAETLAILNGSNSLLYEFLLFPLSHGKNKYEVSFHFNDFQNEAVKIKSENKLFGYLF